MAKSAIFFGIVCVFVLDSGAQSWTQQNSGVTAVGLSGIYFWSADSGVAVGSNATILKTTDGGANWSPRPSGLTIALALHAVDFVSSDTGFIAGDETILKTVNGGESWTRPFNVFAWLHDLDFGDAATGYAVGNTLPFPSLGILYKTSDGGNNWTPQTGITPRTLRGVSFLDANTGYVAGDTGTLLKTVDGGANWTPLNSGVAVNLRELQFVDANTGWVVGTGGTILKTTDGGSNWNPQASNTTQHLIDLHFLDANSGYVVGNSGTILYTSDGGVNWVSQSPGSIQQFQAVYFHDAAAGFVTGSSGNIWKYSPASGIRPRSGTGLRRFSTFGNRPGFWIPVPGVDAARDARGRLVPFRSP